MPPAVAVVGAVASVAGTVVSYNAQKRASRASQAQQELQTARERRQAIREAQIRRAQTMAAASAQGATGSSAVAGGLGSLGSQLGSGLGFSSAMSSLSQDINRYNQRAATWGAIAGIGSAAFQGAGGWNTLFSTFGKGPTKAPTPAARPTNQTPHAQRAGF